MYHADGNKEKVIYTNAEACLDISQAFSVSLLFIFEKRPPRDVRRQISDVASDARKISLTGIVDKTGRLFAGLQIPQRLK